MLALTFLGNAVPAGVIASAAAGWLFVISRRLEAVFVVALTGSASLVGWLLKMLIARPRPGDGMDETGFPSGHTLFAMSFYGFLFYLTPELIKSRLLLIILRSGLTLAILFTGTSRIHLGMHWPLDVFGSLILGALILAPAVVLYERKAKNRGG
ncbi:MAG: phosphatase PAP2 family protein [Chloroflexi bacterium]|nr:phosphatase PAP2 family protein [Chloroflexota bacterium]